MTSLISSIQTTLWNIFHRPGFADIIDIIIIAVIIYKLLMLTRQTRGSAVLKGLVLLLVATIISDLAGLTALNWVLTGIVNNGAVVLVILFQPQIRKALESIGRGTILDHSHTDNQAEHESVISEIIQAVMNLSESKTGALIVFERKTGLRDVIETGTAIDAKVSAPLLENIFVPNTPLHDGAVVIRDMRVVSAACFLTLSENTSINRSLGTRHRAALGISETTDAVVIVVSEETGIISMARQGKLARPLNQKSLRQILNGIYFKKDRNLWSIVKHKKEKEAK